MLVVDNASKAGPGGHRFILELSLYQSHLCVHLCRFGRRVDGRELGCADVADVAATVRPRYHFAATHGVGYQAIDPPNGLEIRDVCMRRWIGFIVCSHCRWNLKGPLLCVMWVGHRSSSSGRRTATTPRCRSTRPATSHDSSPSPPYHR